MVGIASIYRWKGEIHRDSECLLLIKTTRDRFDALRERIVALHPYELPDVIAVDIALGLERYLGRIENETVSGHWLFSYLRGDISTGNAALVVVNLHPTAMMNSVGIAVPAAVEAALISGSWEVSNLLPGDGSAAMKLPHTSGEKVTLPLLAPLTAQAFRLRRIVAATALPLIALPPPGR